MQHRPRRRLIAALDEPRSPSPVSPPSPRVPSRASRSSGSPGTTATPPPRTPPSRRSPAAPMPRSRAWRRVPDALAGSYLAGIVGAPVLLTEPTALP